MTQRALAWTLVVSVLASWCLAALAVATDLAPAHAPDTRPLPVADEPRVVLVGIPGLTWDVVDETTPTLQDLTAVGGSAALVLRATPEVACTEDAWLTVGAGERRGGTGCARDSGGGSGFYGEGSTTPDLSRLEDAAAAGGTCLATHGLRRVSGENRAVPAAGEGLLGDPELDAECRIHLVEGPIVYESDRSDVLPETDAALARLIEQQPPGTTVVVAGMGQTAGRATAQALVVADVSAETAADPTLLTSASTRQAGLVQLVDLTPTLLQLAALDPPEATLPGAPVEVVRENADESAASRAADLAEAISWTKVTAPGTLAALALVLLPALALGLWRWAATSRGGASRKGPGDAGDDSAAAPGGLGTSDGNGASGGPGISGGTGAPGTFLTAVSLLVMAVPAATFLAGLAPWWRAEQPWPTLTALVLGIGAALVALAWWLPPARRSPLAAPAIVAALTLVVLGVDTIWSSRLGLVSVMGLQPVTAGRFYGQGNVGFGLVLGATLVLMAAVLTWLRAPAVDVARVDHSAAAHPTPTRSFAPAPLIRAGEPSQPGEPSGPSGLTDLRHGIPSRGEAMAAVLLLGFATTALGAAPQAGADFGSVPAMGVATGLVALAALGRRWTTRSLLLVGSLAAALAVAVMVLDWLRPVEARTHLGDFVQSVLDGEALGIVTRKLDQSLGILVSYPVSWLAVLALAGLAVLVWRRPAWSAALWEQSGMPPVAAAAVVALVLTWVLNDSGIAAVAACLTVLIGAGVAVLAARRPVRG